MRCVLEAKSQFQVFTCFFSFFNIKAGQGVNRAMILMCHIVGQKEKMNKKKKKNTSLGKIFVSIFVPCFYFETLGLKL